MKASVFIQTALIDQMQQIADLGLWFHLAKLIPSGVEVLARVNYAAEWDALSGAFSPTSSLVPKLYSELFPGSYKKYPTSKDFYSDTCIWMAYGESERHKYLILPITDPQDSSEAFIFVHQWFEDFKAACRQVLEKIESGKLQDIEVLAQKEI